MKVEMSVEDGKFSFDLSSLIESMTYEQKMDVIREFSMQRDVRDQVIKQLTGEECEFYWGDDNDRRLKILSALENELISNYKWSFIYEIKDFIRDHDHNKQLYWKLFHSSEFFRDWLRINNIQSNYNFNSSFLRRFEKFVRNTFERLENKEAK